MSASDRRIILRSIVFDAKSVLIGGLFREIIRPEAIDRTFHEEIDVRSMVNHNVDMLLGRRSAETLTLVREPGSVLAEIAPPDASYARDVMTSIERGDIDGGSFQFQTLSDRWYVEDGEEVREVTDMRVFEVGPVVFPAYEDSDVYMGRALPRGSIAAARRRQYQAEHALDFWTNREVRHMENDHDLELAMLKWPNGETVERQVAVEGAEAFRRALKERFGQFPANTEGWYWSRAHGWFQESRALRDRQRQQAQAMADHQRDMKNARG